MEEVTTYDITVRRGDTYWIIEVPGVGFTQARHLREVGAMAHDLAAVMTESDDVEIGHVQLEIPADAQAKLDAARELRERSAELQGQAAAELRAAARILHTDHHMSLRDVGKTLGVSHQRAHELVTS